MKNTYVLKIFLKVLLFAAGLLLAGWFFMPWRQVGEAVLLSASNHLPEPAYLSYSTVRSTAGGFVVNDLEIRNLMGMVNVFFSSVTIIPDVGTSLLSMAPTCRITFTGAVIGDIAVTPFSKIPSVAPGNGRAVVSINRQGVFLDGLRSVGELSTSGSLLINLSGMEILWADVAIDIDSETFEEYMPHLALILPLQQESQGRWFLRRLRGSE